MTDIVDRLDMAVRINRIGILAYKSVCADARNEIISLRLEKASQSPTPLDPETAADNAALIAAIPQMVEALANLQQRSGAVATWINHWDLPFDYESEWCSPTGDQQLFFDALNKASAVLASIGRTL